MPDWNEENGNGQIEENEEGVKNNIISMAAPKNDSSQKIQITFNIYIKLITF